ncbi:hypothetical protein Salmuc_04400 [Salipiger mucosus DSM 16094]|uniref:Glycosyltransferase RgtA/B/C/D-like domain-containing protein n=2 Tax=Salipiger mucosus TaxID=263378 RepID=S9QG17_9RHOB|nr:hypothetical protein Salmuc_04400 [Salipiger mucosus DSM 16094]
MHVSQSRDGTRAASVLVAILGATFYAWMLHLSATTTPAAFGSEIYDQLWLSLKEGRLDVPARVARIEGHYTPDGTAFIYHGLAPLLTRALLDPFVTVGTASLAPVTIWFWAVLGTTFYHAAFLRTLDQVSVSQEKRLPFVALIGILTWIGGPGVLLTANHGFYQEPIAVAYALFGGFIYIWMQAVRSGRISGRALITVAVLAALCVHARPHLAVALYCGVAALIVWALGQRGRAALLPAVLGVAILGAGGAGYLGLNKMRFGSATEVHGSFAAGGTQYGMTFWGFEDEDSARASGFAEHGRFNPGRIVPNLVVYAVSPPQLHAPSASEAVLSLHRAYTEPRFGLIRIEVPDAGIVFLWTFWSIAAAVGIGTLRRARRGEIVLVGVAGIAALLMLSYATIAPRYHVDLWPLVAALAIVGLPHAIRRVSAMRGRWYARLLVVGVIGTLVNVQTAGAYRYISREHPASDFAAWDAATCSAHAAEKGFDAPRIQEICRAPRVETES